MIVQRKWIDVEDHLGTIKGATLQNFGSTHPPGLARRMDQR